MARRISGYAAVFNSRSSNLGGFYETIDPHAFDNVLRSGDPDTICLFDHEGQLLGRTTSGSLRLSVDGHGLRYDCELADTTHANDVYALIKRGDVTTSSFSFVCRDDTWEANPDGSMERRILDVAFLMDVSPVTRPAYEATSTNIG
jgi:uncharacterized protein